MHFTKGSSVLLLNKSHSEDSAVTHQKLASCSRDGVTETLDQGKQIAVCQRLAGGTERKKETDGVSVNKICRLRGE